MLKIKLQRIGRKREPYFKVVVVEAKSKPKTGKTVEQIGYYNAIKGEVSLKPERIKYWLSVGAKPTDVVYNFLVSKGIIEGKKKNVLPKKSPIKKKKELKEKKE